MANRVSEAASHIRREMGEILFRQPLPVVSISIAFATLTTAMAVDQHDPVLYVFALLGSLWSVGRIAILYAFARRYRPRDYEKWEKVYAFGSLVFSVILSSTVGYVFIWGSGASQVLAAALLFAYGGGLVARTSIVPWICRTSLAIAVIISTIALIVADNPVNSVLLVLVALMFIGGVSTTNVIYNAMYGYIDGQRRLDLAVNTDALTGLPNRAALKKHISDCVELRSNGGLLGAHFIDLDRFKQVNDTHGHIIGDEVLRFAAERIASSVREQDFVSRYGGDEFVVVQSELNRRQDAELLGQRLVARLSEPYEIDGRRIEIGASDGIALVAAGDTAAIDLLALSDAALYQAKKAGRGRVSTIMGGETDAPPRAAE